MSDNNQAHDVRDANWAAPVKSMDVSQLPAKAVNLNVQGRRPMSPLQGFGQLWQKTYRIRLTGVTVAPATVIADWKEHYPQYWPQGNSYYGSTAKVEPGEIAVINLAGPGGMMLSTGVRVIYVDDESFSFMTPQGHMFAGMITFSAFDDEGVTVIQIQALVRASDPLYETSFRLGFGHRAENRFWFDTLSNLAAHFGATRARPSLDAVRIDKKVQWSEARNIWYNAAIRTALYTPITLGRRILGRA